MSDNHDDAAAGDDSAPAPNATASDAPPTPTATTATTATTAPPAAADALPSVREPDTAPAQSMEHASAASTATAAAAAATAAKPRVWTVVTALIALAVLQGAFGAFLIAGAMFAKGVKLGGDGNDAMRAVLTSSPWLLAAMFALSGLALLIVIVVGAAASPHPWRERLAFRSARARVVDVVLVTLCSFSFGYITTPIAKALGAYDDSLLKTFSDAIMSAPAGTAVFIALFGTLTGALEEPLYRGFLQTRLVARWGARAGVVVTAAAFGVMHMDLVQGTFAFLFGLVVGYVAYRTGSIATGLYAHAINNFVAFASPWLAASLDENAAAADGPGWVMAGAGVVVLTVAFTVLYRRLRARAPPTATAPPPAASTAKTNWIPVGVSGCLVVVVLLAGGIVIGVLAALRMAKEKPDPAQIALVEQRARFFAEEHDARACVEESLTVAAECESVGRVACTAEGRSFLLKCVRMAPTSGGVCDDVPPPGNIIGVGLWADRECKRLAPDDPMACAGILGALAPLCAPPSP